MGMRLAIGFFDPEDPAPIEFTYMRPDHRLMYTRKNIADPVQAYIDAAKFFD